jgi:protein ImuB
MFAVLHIAAFALHAVLRTEPGVADRPAALFSGGSKKSVVVATTPAARTAGVELGMTAPQAVARCPALFIRTAKADAETEARAAFLAVAFTLSPAIEATAPGICTIDLRGLGPDTFLPVARSAVAQLAVLGLPASAGIARTPLLALYAARSTAKVRHIASVGEEEHFLAPLPLATADPSPELAAVFHQWGLRTLGDLLALPRDEIIRRFGAAGLALWQRASGGATRPLLPVVPPQTFSATMELEHEIETLEPLLFILRRFLDRLTLELSVAQFVAAELSLGLRLEDDTSHTRRFRLPEPTADPEILFRALHTHLESLQTAATIAAVVLELTPVRPLVRQQGIFDTGLCDPHGFAETLARVSALVGSERIGTPRPADTHRPDTFTLTPPAPVIFSTVTPPLHAPQGLPLRRFRPPLRVGLTETGEGKTFLWADGARGEISFRSPPYPRNGHWWQQDRAWSRVEWDIALVEGGLFRLILDGDDYFLEGEYD